MRRYLVVADEALGGEWVLDAIRQRLHDGPCRFHVVVPAASPGDPLYAGADDAIAVAARHLDAVLGRLHAAGILATGEIESAEASVTVTGELRSGHFDEVILPTLEDRRLTT
ncbi:MAG TPA: hypothetical protein VFZ17_12160 [Acidimicrobiia bacterium]|nr:hypothetical protein [Acidimicrobiia bacterium]